MNAITEQAGKLGHISNLFYAEPYVKAAEKLCRKAGMSNVFFANFPARRATRARSSWPASTLPTSTAKGRGGPSSPLHKVLPRPHHHHPLRHWSRTCSTTISSPLPRASARRRQRLRQREAMAGHDVCAVILSSSRARAACSPWDCEGRDQTVAKAAAAAHRRGRPGRATGALRLPAVRHPADVRQKASPAGCPSAA